MTLALGIGASPCSAGSASSACGRRAPPRRELAAQRAGWRRSCALTRPALGCSSSVVPLRTDSSTCSRRSARHVLVDCRQNGACRSAPPLRPLSPLALPGRAGRNRTRNLRFWRPLLYQLSYDPRSCARSGRLPALPRLAMQADASRQRGQNFFSSSRAGSLRRFFSVV